jgi:hypothetical protein
MPDLSALTQPGLGAAPTGPNQQTAALNSMQEQAGQMSAAATQAQKDAAVSTANPNPPRHAVLLKMIEGLGIGLSSAATSMATRGKEGGAPEVAQYYAGQQQQQIQAQQARIQARDAKVRQDLTTFDTAHALYQTYANLATAPDLLTKAHLDLANAQQEGKLRNIETTRAAADFQQTYGVTADQYNSLMGGSGTTGGGQIDPQAAKNLNTFATQKINAAAQILGADHPTVTAAQQVLADPKSTPAQQMDAVGSVNRAVALKGQTTEATIKQSEAAKGQQEADPLFKLSQPEELAKPGAQAALQAYIDNPANAKNLNGLAQARVLIVKAGIAQQHDLDLAAKKAFANKNAEQAATAGDPNVAGQMLYEGGLTLADLKSRGSTPKQIIDATRAAGAYAAAHGGKYNASDEIVGEKTLGEPTNQVFFGSARSLVQGGGMLDQLKAAHDALGNTKIPAYNTIKDWRDYQAGQPQLATYRAAVLAAADDAAKVMGGGQPTDALRDSFLQTFNSNINNLGFDGALEQSRTGVRSQVVGRIGPNRYIQQREGDILAGGDRGILFAAPVGATGKARGSDGNFYYHDARGNILGPAPAGN